MVRYNNSKPNSEYKAEAIAYFERNRIQTYELELTEWLETKPAFNANHGPDFVDLVSSLRGNLSLRIRRTIHFGCRKGYGNFIATLNEKVWRHDDYDIGHIIFQTEQEDLDAPAGDEAEAIVSYYLRTNHPNIYKKQGKKSPVDYTYRNNFAFDVKDFGAPSTFFQSFYPSLHVGKIRLSNGKCRYDVHYLPPINDINSIMFAYQRSHFIQ